MKYLRQTDPRFQYLGSKVGLFLLLLGGFLLAMAALLAWQQDFFRKMVALQTAPDQGQYITAGMDVTLHGIRVGRVTRVVLDEHGLPLLHLSVREDAVRWLTSQASIHLSGLDPLAKPYLNLLPGHGDGPWPPEKRLPFTRDLTLGETTAELERQLRPVIQQAATFVSSLNHQEGEVQQALKNLAALTTEVSTRIPPLLAETENTARLAHILLSRLAAEDGELNRTLQHTAEISAEVEKKLPVLLNEMEASLSSLRRTTAEIEATTQSLTPEVRTLLTTSRATVEKADRLLLDLREIWFLKVFFPRRSEDPPHEQP